MRKYILIALALAVPLAAGCGGGGGASDDGAQSAAAPPAGTGSASGGSGFGNAFLARVGAVIATASAGSADPLSTTGIDPAQDNTGSPETVNRPAGP